MRHDAVSIHVVVLLARSDGSAANPRFDYRRVRETCLAAEQRHGLQVTPPIDGTATPATTRAETEKAGRGGADNSPRTRVSGEQARVALRREVRRCAVTADSQAEFLALLRRRGLLLRERHSTLPPVPSSTGTRADSDSDSGDASRDAEPQVTGYAVGLPGDRDADGEPVLYSGGRLGPDLTLPRLRQRWTDTPSAPARAAAPGRGTGPPRCGPRRWRPPRPGSRCTASLSQRPATVPAGWSTQCSPPPATPSPPWPCPWRAHCAVRSPRPPPTTNAPAGSPGPPPAPP